MMPPHKPSIHKSVAQQLLPQLENELEYIAVDSKQIDICLEFYRELEFLNQGHVEAFCTASNKIALAQKINQMDYHIELVYWHDEVIGLIEYSSDNQANSNYLNNLFLRRQYRSSGFAEVILQHVYGYFKQQHQQQLLSKININNNLAMRFFRKHQWQYYGQPQEQTQWMLVDL